MRNKPCLLWLAFSLLFAVPAERLAAQAGAGTIVVFDVPGSSCVNYAIPCTTPTGINSHGTIAGYYQDTKLFIHAFYRTADGAITSFDAPGVRCPSPGKCTVANAINDTGAITGYYASGTNSMVGPAYSGFVRASDGSFATFTVPDSVGTFPVAINSSGAVAGVYYDPHVIVRAFVRDPSGAMTTFSVPGTSGPGLGSYGMPVAINSQGEIAGEFDQYQASGFERSSGGHFTAFNPPNSSGTIPTAMDDAGRVAGYYTDSVAQIVASFLRDEDGTYTLFSAFDSIDTEATAINESGTIVGRYYSQADGMGHGFYRLQDGAIGTFDPPGAVYTQPTGISSTGIVTGYFIVAESGGHAFLRIGH